VSLATWLILSWQITDPVRFRCRQRIDIFHRFQRQFGQMQYTGPTDYMLATAMEAVLGAIDVDSGEDAGAVRDAMVKIGLTAAAPG
jgi:hypothetical protein